MRPECPPVSLTWKGLEMKSDFDRLLGDDVVIVSPDGHHVGPVKASVQGEKIYIRDETVVVEEGSKVLRALPNGKSEEFLVLRADFIKDPRGHRPDGGLSHYKLTVRKSSSLVPTPNRTTVNIANSQGIQIGDGNVQNVIGTLQQLVDAIGSAQAPVEQKNQAKSALRAFLSHPLVNTILGAAATALASKL